MLLPVLVDREPLKVYIPAGAELRLHGARDVDGRLHVQLLDAALHDGELERNHPSHLNRAAERNFTIPLREMEITDAELGTRDVHRQVHLAATREVLDVAIAAVLRAAGDRARALAADLLFDIGRRAAGMYVGGIRRLRDDAVHVRARLDQLALALVPRREDFRRRRAPEDPRVDEPCEAHAGDVP